MPFPYVYVCDLLEKLDQLANRPLQLGTKEKTNMIAIKWLGLHRSRLNEQSVDSQAVIMMLHPEQWTDRDYGLNVERLEQLIARALSLPRNLYDELQLWRNGPSHGDLAACVVGVMEQMTLELATRATASKVSVEEINRALLSIATHNPNSSAEVRGLASKVKTHDSIELLGKLYRSFRGREAKWLTRLILKDYGPVKFPTRLDMSSHNAFLPRCVQMNAEVALDQLLPVLCEGTSLIYGTSAASSASNHLPSSLVAKKERFVSSSCQSNVNQLSAPSVAATERLRRKYPPPQSMVNQLPTPSRTADSATQRVSSVHSTANKLSTPPTTAPHRLSSAPVPSSARSVRGQPRRREPLASLTTNTVSSSQSFGAKSQEQTSTQTVSAATDTVHCATPRASQNASAQRTSGRAVHSASQHSQRNHSKSSTPMTISGSGVCILTTTRCPLINCIFLLSPCISSSPYILENLLAWHGCCIIPSIRALSNPSLPRHCPHTGKRYRKIALVEPNRTNQTVEFLKSIEELNLRRSVRKGKEKVREKQWVEIYDWRLLECVGKMDMGKDPAYNPWRRCWMGAV